MPASENPPNDAKVALRSRWRAFGPGLLFAGAAVGVSHIVQSTRGGAAYGTGALLIVVLSCLVKWPAFRFGSLYAAVTGESLLAGYRRQGRWVLAVFGLLTLAIIFTTLAAVTVVSAGLLMNLFPQIAPSLEGMGLAPQYQAIMVSGLLLLFTTVLLIRGYRWLERIMKVVMPVLAIATLTATVISLFRISADDVTWLPAIDDAKDVELAAGIIGWMPAPLDIAIWTSLWALARARAAGSRPQPRNVLLDFDIGYVTTLLLAVCFVVMGAAIMHGGGQTFPASSVAFAGQVVSLYTESLGDWSWGLIAFTAFLAMLSTTVTVCDGFPRAVAALVSEAWPDRQEGPEGSRRMYWLAYVVGVIGAMLILIFALGRKDISFTSLVDFVTITSFIAAPVLAFFNHRAANAAEIPAEFRPGPLLQAWSWLGIVVMGSFALGYIIFRIWLVSTAG